MPSLRGLVGDPEWADSASADLVVLTLYLLGLFGEPRPLLQY